VGALYASGRSASEISDIISSIRLLDIFQRKREGPGLLGRNKTARLLTNVLGGDITFADLRLPLALVAVDIETSEEVVIREGSVVEGVLATTAVPGVFPPQPWKGRYLVDGGVTNPLPSNVVRDMGADHVVAIHTTGRFPDVCTPPSNVQRLASGSLMHAMLRRSRWTQVLDILERSICIMTEELVARRLAESPPDVTIEVFLTNIGAFDLSKLAECVRAGEEAARAHLPELQALCDSAGL
jgi:NTE family protein